MEILRYTKFRKSTINRALKICSTLPKKEKKLAIFTTTIKSMELLSKIKINL
jgi:hypothetical protein